MVSTVTGGEVQAVADSLGLQKLGEVERGGQEEAGHDVEDGALVVAGHPVPGLGHGQEPVHRD